MIKKAIYLTVMASLLTFSSSADTVVTNDFPNPGDTTTTTTITTGNPVTTGNLLSHQWNDGTWTGTMFPDSSDINENIYLTGKDGAFAESTVNSQDILTEQELQQGLTSTLTAKVRWWNKWDSTIEMKQTATNGIDTTTQTIILQDTTNHNNQFNSHTNTLIIAPDEENSHGTLTTRFTFDIDNAAGTWNNGHSGPDIIEPDLRLNYSSLSTTTVTDTVFCYQKTPPTCPAQQELADVETFLDTFEEDLYLDDIYVYEEEYFMPEEVDIEYSFNTEIFEEDEFEIEEDYLTLDEFFFEDDYYQDDYYEEPFMEEFFPETLAFEEVEFFDEPPPMEMFTELPPIEEMYFEDEYFEEEMYMEVFTDEAFIEEFDEMFDEMPMEEMNVEMAEEMFEEMFEEYFEEEPPMELVEEFAEEFKEEPVKEEEPLEEVALVEEEPVEEEPLETKPVKEEPIEETSNEQIEEQPSSEEPIAGEPEETTDVAEQEEVVEEPVEAPGQESSEDVEVDIDIKVAALEKVIQSKISNEMQRVSLTLDAVNQIVAKEMVANQPDMSSYFNMNAALFDTRQLPSGDPAFFMQVSLDSYNKTIYNTQANLVATDPVVQYQIKLNKAQQATDAAYIKLKGLMDARSN
jgi:hypothetical protein